MYFGLYTKFPGTDSYVIARALSNSSSDSRIDSANFLLDSLARPPRAKVTRLRVRLWLKAQGLRKVRSRPADMLGTLLCGSHAEGSSSIFS